MDSDVFSRVSLATISKPFQLYGIIRVSAIKDFSKNLKPYIGIDNTLVYYLAIIGKFHLVEDERFFRRYNYQNENYQNRISRYRNVLLKGHNNFLKNYIPNLYIILMMFKIILRSDKDWFTKFKLFIVLLLTAPVKFIISYGKQV